MGASPTLVREKRTEAANLERRPAELVNDAFGLTPELSPLNIIQACNIRINTIG
jgi:hypothetical protein